MNITTSILKGRDPRGGPSPVQYTKAVFKGAYHSKWCAPFGEVKTLDEKNFTLVAPASTMSIDRDREIVLPSAFDLTNFKKNPLFLWGHNWWGGPETSLGHVKDVHATEDSLVATFKYDASFCDYALKVWNKVLAKSIRGFSVGFRMVEWVTASSPDEKIDALPERAARALRRGDIWLVHTKVELIEISQVLIPCNVDCHTDQDQEVEEMHALGLASPNQVQTERTDEHMDLSKLSADLEGVKTTLASMQSDQTTLTAALKSVTETNLATVTMLSEIKSAPLTTPAPPAEKPLLASDLKSLEQLPEALQKQLVEAVVEGLTS